MRRPVEVSLAREVLVTGVACGICTYRTSVIESVTEAAAGSPPQHRPDVATLQDQLGAALTLTSRAMTAYYRSGLDGIGLTYPQYLVILVLWQHRTLSVGELSRRLQLSTGTLSRCSNGWRPPGW